MLVDETKLDLGLRLGWAENAPARFDQEAVMIFSGDRKRE
jgi:hypothetical protein